MKRQTFFAWGIVCLLGFAYLEGLKAAPPTAARIDDDGSLRVTASGVDLESVFVPEFIAVYSPTSIASVAVKSTEPLYNLIGVKRPDGSIVQDVFQMGEPIALESPHVDIRDGGVRWLFKHEACEVEADLSLPDGDSDARLRYTFHAKRAGVWSVAYSGAPATAIENVRELFQPLAWNERRLPQQSFLIPDDQCSIPGCLVQSQQTTVGVMADPWQFPFVMPNALVRRFGVTLRNATGLVQPLLFAPFPGAKDCRFEAGESRSYTVLLVARSGPLSETFEHVARRICGFRDRRENTLNSLNEALENILDFAQSEAGRFDRSNRAFTYPDSSGTVKNVSALHPLSLAMVTDNDRLFHGQGVPILEFLLSREKFLFALDAQGLKSSQFPSQRLAGPASPISELAALHRMSKGATPFFRASAERLQGVDRMLNLDWVSRGDTWQNDLWLYRITLDPRRLASACAKADRFIDERVNHAPTDFSEAGTGAFFDNMLVPWKELYELWLETRNPKYLAAAHKGARHYAQLIWFYPAVPDGEVTVNASGFAPKRGSLDQHGLVPAAKESVPAWRVSEQGLMCEGNGTVQRIALYLAMHAPCFMRLAQDTNDAFLHDIARSAIVGRFAGFPGYHFNTQYSTAQEKADFALHSFEEIKGTTSMHYNHSLPMANLVLDYLFAETYARAHGAIEFPAEFAEGYAYLGGRVYGEPGKFYDLTNLRPWMPKGLVKSDNVQVNYIAARGERGLGIAMLNQSERALPEVNIQLDLARFVNPPTTLSATVWRDNQRLPTTIKVEAGKACLSLSPKGITALYVEGLTPKVQFQNRVKTSSIPENGLTHHQFQTPFGNAHAIILSFGPELKWLYVYLTASSEMVKSAGVRITGPRLTESLTDTTFPFEFSLPLRPEDHELELLVEAMNVDNQSLHSDVIPMVAP